MASKVSAFESLRVLTLPVVRVALWIKLEIEPALLLENSWKPRVVAPVRFHNHCLEGISCGYVGIRTTQRAFLRKLDTFQLGLLIHVRLRCFCAHAALPRARLGI